MSRHTTKRRTRSDKFPLTLHSTGQYCKKINERIYYFGTNKKQALERYLDQATYLHGGQNLAQKASDGSMILKELCDLYLDYQHSRVLAHNLSARHHNDQISSLSKLTSFFGKGRRVKSISTLDLQKYKRKLQAAYGSAHRLNLHILSQIISSNHTGMAPKGLYVLSPCYQGTCQPRARRMMSVGPVRASVWWNFCNLFHRVRGEMRELLDLRLSRDLPVLRQDLQADDPLNLLASLCLQDPPWRFGEEYPGDTPGPAAARLSSPKPGRKQCVYRCVGASGIPDIGQSPTCLRLCTN